ncbi:MAG TPA: histidine kinase [Bacteroidetes bacterium]|nr:histidine kinase [Bacteroidota bacterium]HIL58981.1 histidine kinase [Rhodothermales bacterium]
MLRSRRLRAFLARYVAPYSQERDLGFYETLSLAARAGLRVLGWFGVLTLAAYAAARVISAVARGTMADQIAAGFGEVLSDKLIVLALAAVFLGIARFRLSLTVTRVIVGVFVLVAGTLLVYDDFVRGDFNLTAGWLALLLLLVAGAIPFQPLHTLLLGIALTSIHTAFALQPASDGTAFGGEIRRFVFLLLVTFVATAVESALYQGRHAQHRSRRKLERLRHLLTTQNTRLALQARAVENQNSRLEAQAVQLEAQQRQLVQQEKMASLGQLTGGIAHELKNPLNFITNFAGLSVELLEEMEEEMREAPDRPVGEALDQSADLLQDLKTNAEKIREHGRRADGIIRSMLAHSRAKPGPRRLAKLNTLLDEYVGLAYHGMRAEHQGFNVEVVRDFGADVGEVAIVPEELGRVFLNLLDNAFAATRERASEAPPGYEARVRIATRALSDHRVEVRIEDNGPGISPELADQIFQPFFTTKPTGEGTGLGLSLSYEIVVNGHGGTLTVDESQSGGAAFVMTLPTGEVD